MIFDILTNWVFLVNDTPDSKFSASVCQSPSKGDPSVTCRGGKWRRVHLQHCLVDHCWRIQRYPAINIARDNVDHIRCMRLQQHDTASSTTPVYKRNPSTDPSPIHLPQIAWVIIFDIHHKVNNAGGMQWAGDREKKEAACAQGRDTVEKPKRARNKLCTCKEKATEWNGAGSPGERRLNANRPHLSRPPQVS
jgi:hypothetical protein